MYIVEDLLSVLYRVMQKHHDTEQWPGGCVCRARITTSSVLPSSAPSQTYHASSSTSWSIRQALHSLLPINNIIILAVSTLQHANNNM